MDQLRLRKLPVTALHLASELGVSLRTMYRDIADLQAMGAPIRGEGGLGYVMEPGFFMPSLRFDDTELEALALGAKLVAARADAHLAQSARSASAKISAALGDQVPDVLINGSMEAAPSALSTTPHLARLRAAVQGRAVLEINYVNTAGQHSHRRARPLGLTVFDTAWLLTIWCERATDFRHLRVDRIETLAETGTIFRHERGKRFQDCLTLESERRQHQRQ